MGRQDPKKAVNASRRGNTMLFLLAVLLSFTIWFIHNLSQDFSDIVTVNVRAVSNIEGRAQRSSEPVSVAARCTATGFRHISMSLRRKEVSVTMDRGDFAKGEGDFYLVDAPTLMKYSQAIFGDRVHPETFISAQVQFRFPAENHKKVPVQAVRLLSYRPQYMAVGPMVISPDSVTVYGDPRLLSGLDRVMTRQIVLSDIRGSVHGVVRLETPAGLRLSSDEVTYSLDVLRFVEIRAKVPVGVRNVPAGHRLSVLPSTADVVFRCMFPLSASPADRVELFIDWSDFAMSRSGRCVARYDALPEGVIEMEIEPEVFECLETL